MSIARLGAASGAAVIVLLCAAGPAFATGSPSPGTGGGAARTTPGTGGGPTKTTPSPTPTKPGGGHAPSAAVSPRSFSGGDMLTFTVEHCAVVPTITDLDHLFAATRPFVPAGAKGSYAARETTRKNLVEGRKYKVTVHCGRWSTTFVTSPHKRVTPTPTPTSGQPTGVPSGAPQTGDGSRGGGTGLIVGGMAAVVAGLAGGAFLYTRRRSSAGA